MIIKNVSRAQLDAALAEVNAAQGYCLVWKSGPQALNQSGSRWQLTIKSARSRIRGARLSWSGRNIPAASWHAHGHFFETLLAIEPAAVIQTGIGCGRITAAGGNWKDWNAGSLYSPAMMSSLSVF